MRLPDFIVAGATRSGTSTLYGVLKKHPHIFLPEDKELHFFDHDAAYGRGLAHYAKNFEGCGAGQVCGDVTPTYMNHGYVVSGDKIHAWQPEEDAIVRLARDLPEVKIILSLRHPATRTYSFFNRTLWQGHEAAESLEQVLQEERAGKRKPESNPLCPLYLGHYKIHLEHLFKHIPKERVLILVMEEWTRNPEEALRQIEEFLGVRSADMALENLQAVNEGRQSKILFLQILSRVAPRSKVIRLLNRYVFSKPGYEALAPEIFESLCQDFEEDILYIEKILGRPVWWEKKL